MCENGKFYCLPRDFCDQDESVELIQFLENSVTNVNVRELELKTCKNVYSL